MSALYMVASVSVPPPGKSASAVVAGIYPLAFITAYPSARPNQAAPSSENVCVAGVRFAKEVGVESHAELVVASGDRREDRKSTRLNSSHVAISYAVFCLKKKTK